MSLITRGIGPSVTIAAFGFGPHAPLPGEAVKGLVASFFGLNAVMQSPVQLIALEIANASLEVHMDLLKLLMETGLIEDTASIEDALRGSLDMKSSFDGDGEIG